MKVTFVTTKPSPKDCHFVFDPLELRADTDRRVVKDLVSQRPSCRSLVCHEHDEVLILDRVLCRKRCWRRTHDLIRERPKVGRAERWPQGSQLVRDASKRPYVGPFVVRATRHELW
jgi:hypothetical protein